MNRTFFGVALASLLVVCQASAQSINIDFGNPGAGPASNYAAAGQAGFWNKIPAAGGTDYILKDLAGNMTTVHFSQSGAEGVLTASDPSVSGNDATLMNDGIITHVYGTDSCFFFTGLTPGTYDLVTYAWRPSNPSLIAKSFADNTPGIELSGGAWPGQQTHGVTYGHHIVTVDQSGAMTSHSGLNSSSGEPIGAVCNGMQLRLLPTTTVPAIGTYGLAFLAALLFAAAAWIIRHRATRPQPA
ncbi:MAG: hypothetical protein HY287_09840 [Planctomycetes bacterium]|nr:hypothetical protein [Planctomycetota bacterium]MBI3834615.1 hypothetical protein [Planctomycetota bacterium]